MSHNSSMLGGSNIVVVIIIIVGRCRRCRHCFSHRAVVSHRCHSSTRLAGCEGGRWGGRRTPPQRDPRDIRSPGGNVLGHPCRCRPADVSTGEKEEEEEEKSNHHCRQRQPSSSIIRRLPSAVNNDSHPPSQHLVNNDCSSVVGDRHRCPSSPSMMTTTPQRCWGRIGEVGVLRCWQGGSGQGEWLPRCGGRGGVGERQWACHGIVRVALVGRRWQAAGREGQ